jgi:hypothetical protein
MFHSASPALIQLILSENNGEALFLTCWHEIMEMIYINYQYLMVKKKVSVRRTYPPD